VLLTLGPETNLLEAFCLICNVPFVIFIRIMVIVENLTFMLVLFFSWKRGFYSSIVYLSCRIQRALLVEMRRSES